MAALALRGGNGAPATVVLSGRLDAYSVGPLWEQAQDALRTRPNAPLLIDCSGVDYCDGAGIALLYDLLLPYAQRVSGQGIVWIGAVAHYLGLLARTLGDTAGAEAHFADAAAIHQRIDAPIWLARTRLEWARMLLARRHPGDAERARQLLGDALAPARELGLGNVERRAVALLAQ